MRVSGGNKFVALIIGALCVWCLTWFPSWAFGNDASAQEVEAVYTSESSPAGMGPDYPDYWVTEDYWVAEGCPVARQVKEDAEKILAPLDGDNISQVAIFCMPNKGFVSPGVWADRLGTYYGVGLSEGPRAHNGMIWLILFNEDQKVTSVHYAIGDGLPAITAGEIGPVLADAEAKVSVEDAIMAVASGYNTVARQNYDPLEPSEPLYGGPIDNSSSEDEASVKLIIWLIAVFLMAVFVTEPLLALGVIFGSYTSWRWMAWPAKLLGGFLEAGANSSSSSYGNSSSSGTGSGRHSSGKSLGGSDRIHRNR